MPIAFERIEPLLLKVEKPGRYTGGEYNQVVRESEPGRPVTARIALAFPDVYDLGMSYHGYSLLYERVNRHENWAAERVFTPWPDMEALMRREDVPLFSLETRRTLAEFDLVGFTLQHEVNYTNILTMLSLGGVPVESKDRRDPFPIIIGGGEGAYSPEPMAPFIDAFVIGDGEEAIEDLCRIVERARAENWTRDQILMELARTPGVYVPEFYDFEYHEDGRVKRVFTTREGVPPVVKKRHFNVTEDFGTIRPVVPLLRTVHDRFAIEIRRGCVNGCRFCQAGMITRPVRERSVEQICEIATQGLANTGYDEISLLSLSSADYTAIGTLVRRMTREFGPRRVSISLPSLRINAFDIDVADEIRGVRKSGFTFAPEAGSERLRQVINKEVDQAEFFRIIEEVFSRGWQTVKFYYMIGLPTEDSEDLDGIVEATWRAAEIGRRHHGRKAIVNVTLSPFVPKSNTPFMWEPQLEQGEMNRRYEYVRRKLRGPNIDVKTNDTRSSFIEAVLARGDRRMSAVVKRAWDLGARFDGWDEYFQYETWLRAFEEIGIDPKFFANRRREEDEVFSYDHIDSNLGKRFLWADQRRAWRRRVMEPCEVGKCAGCVACFDDVEHILALNQPGAADGQERYEKEVIVNRDHKCSRLEEGRRLDEESAEDRTVRSMLGSYEDRAKRLAEETLAKAEACGGGGSGADADDAGLAGDGDGTGGAEVGWVSRPDKNLADGETAAVEPDGEVAAKVFSHYSKGRKRMPERRFAEPEKVMMTRVEFTKQGALRYLSHLDLAKTLGMVLRRARAPLSYSEGFNPKPKLRFSPPLPLGYGGRREVLDVTLTERMSPAALIEALNAVTVDGLEFLAAAEIEMSEPSVDSAVRASVFTVEIDPARSGVAAEEIASALAALVVGETFMAPVKKKADTRNIDLKRSILKAEILPASDETTTKIHVRMTITHEEGLFVQPHAALGHLLGRELEMGCGVRAEREAMILGGRGAAAVTMAPISAVPTDGAAV